MRSLTFLIVLFLALPSLLFASPKPFVVLPSHKVRGMFSVFDSVIGVIYKYEQGDYAGLEVDFGTTGNYYSANKGPNWWSYYCKPIFLGSQENVPIKRLACVECGTHAVFTQHKLNREQVYDLIQRHIHIHPQILEKVERYVASHFSKAPVICVHYRGTDKSCEAPRVPYSTVHTALQTCIKENALNDYKVFVATDEAPFLEYLKNLFPGKILSYSTLLSKDSRPLHTNSPNPDLHGEEALIDCLLLSKGTILLRTESNLSRWSAYFNGDVEKVL